MTLFFLFDAHLHPGEQPLLKALQQTANNLVVIMMRDPYDRDFLTSHDTGMTAFGFRHCQIEAAIERIYQ